MEPTRLIELTLSHDFEQSVFVGELIGRYAAEFFHLPKPDQQLMGQTLQSVYKFLLQNETWYHEKPRIECTLCVTDSTFIVQFLDKAEPWGEVQLRRDLAPEILGSGMMGNTALHQIEAFNLGLEGRRLEVTFLLPNNRDIDFSEQKERVDTVPGEISYRLLAPSEAHEMVSCMYSAYGYTYGIPDVYSHPETSEMMRNGEIVILAAEDEAKQVAGVSTLRKRAAESKIFDLCQTAVKPGYKGKRIFENLLSGVLGTAKSNLNAQGVSATIPNRHLISQDRLEKAGFIPVGIFLGIVPADFLPKQIGPFAQERESFLSVYKPINKPDYNVIYSPVQHEAILTRLCGQLGITTPIERMEPNLLTHGGSVVQRNEVENMKAGFIEVHAAGDDIVDQVFENLTYFKGRHFGSIQLFLDLSDPAAMGYCSRFEAMGFFFAGFFPDEKPWLILQYLNNVPVLFDELVYPFPGSKYIQYHIQWLYRRVKLREKGEFAAADQILPVPDMSQFPADWRTNDDLIVNNRPDDHSAPTDRPN